MVGQRLLITGSTTEQILICESPGHYDVLADQHPSNISTIDAGQYLAYTVMEQ